MAIRRAHGTDISMYQTRFAPPPEKKSDIDFVIMKASQSNWKDDLFDEHYEETRGMTVRGAYHFFHTSFAEVKVKKPAETTVLAKPKKPEKPANQPVAERDTKIEAQPGWQEQADFFIGLVAEKDFHFYALDVERGRTFRNIFTRDEVANIKKWIEYVKEKTGKPVLLYTNQNIYKSELLPNGGNILVGLDLWLAGYPDAPNRDEDDPFRFFEIPGVLNWRLWQYSADHNRKAREYGVEGSHDLDLNVFNGTVEDMLKWLGVAVVPAAESPERHPGVDAPGPIGRTDGAAGSGPGSVPGTPGGAPQPEATGQPAKPLVEDVPQVVTAAVKPRQFTVQVSAEKTVVQAFKERDKAGKPFMLPREPRIRLERGTRLSVSAERKESAKDAGDGLIRGTGNALFYFITDCPAQPSAKGFYVKFEDVTRV
jgi:GH25 family lysozyme M1 (1,4-beta-N-acetylmuramidase)